MREFKNKLSFRQYALVLFIISVMIFAAVNVSAGASKAMAADSSEIAAVSKQAPQKEL